MSRSNAARYIAAETAVSVAVNAALNVVPAALSSGGRGPGDAHSLAGAVLPLFMGAFMSALVPSLLTRRRQLGGKRRDLLASGRPAVVQVVIVSLLLAAASTALGLLAGAVPPLAGGGLMLLAKGAYGGLVAALVTPLALLSLFWRTAFQRVLFGHGWRTAKQAFVACATNACLGVVQDASSLLRVTMLRTSTLVPGVGPR